MDPSFYGMSHYTFRRPEPEGLSDILEEESNLSASVASMGGGMDALSPPSSSRGFVGAELRRDLSPSSAEPEETEEEEELFSQSDDGLDDQDDEAEMSRGEQAITRLAAQRQLAPSHPLGTLHSTAWQSSGDVSTPPSATATLAPAPPALETQEETLRETEDSRTLRPSSSRASLDSIGSNSSRKKPKGDNVWW